jgi:hypothetical protein
MLQREDPLLLADPWGKSAYERFVSGLEGRVHSTDPGFDPKPSAFTPWAGASSALETVADAVTDDDLAVAGHLHGDLPQPPG